MLDTEATYLWLSAEIFDATAAASERGQPLRPATTVECRHRFRAPPSSCRLPLLTPLSGSIRRPAACSVLFLLSSSSLSLALATGSVVCVDSRQAELLAGLNGARPPLPLFAAWPLYPPSTPPLFPYPHAHSCRQLGGGRLSPWPLQSRHLPPTPAGYRSELLPPVGAATVGLPRPHPAGVALHPPLASVKSPPRADSVAGPFVSGSCSNVSYLASSPLFFRATMCGRKGRAGPRRCSSPSWTFG